MIKYICINLIMCVYKLYIVHVMHPSLILSLQLFSFFGETKYFEACSNNKFSLIFPFTAYCCLSATNSGNAQGEGQN